METTKTIDFRKSVHELTKAYPEIIGILASLGFTEIRNKAVRNSIGKLMTIPKGARMKQIPLETVVKALRAGGFDVVCDDKEEEVAATGRTTTKPSGNGDVEKLKGYLRRLADGEPLERVRKDFAEHFGNVDATVIMQAEQELIAEGMPVKQVKDMCDIHSALFHGHTEDAGRSPFLSEDAAAHRNAASEKGWIGQASANSGKASRLMGEPGHPLNILSNENQAIETLVSKTQQKMADGTDDAPEDLATLRQIGIHYAKKGDLLYTLLLDKYNISGPHDVMWTVDDEIRAELSSLCRQTAHDGKWKERAERLLQRAKEMVYKEQNILLPLCAANFTDDEWQQIYRDMQDYATCLGVRHDGWSGHAAPSPKPLAEGTVSFHGGQLTVTQLEALLDALPMEVTFIDHQDINRFFNDNGRPKVFKRPRMALGRSVFTCHPPKVEPMVRAIINDFRSGKRDSVPVWMEKDGRATLVTYLAVRNPSAEYVGTLEIVQDMEAARQHFKGM